MTLNNWYSTLFLYALSHLLSYQNLQAMDFVHKLWGTYKTEWFQAIHNNDLESIKKLVNKVDINTQDSEGNTALMLKSAGPINIVKFLLAVPGIDVNIQNNNGETALIRATTATCAGDGEQIIRLLLEVPAIKVNLQDKQGRSAFIQAALSCSAVSVKLLSNIPGLDFNAHDKDGYTALLCAAQFCPDLVKLLLRIRGIDINRAEFTHGNTALLAAFGRESNVIRLLKRPDVNINVQNNRGETALILAVASGYRHAVKHLLDTPCVKINLKDSLFKMTALKRAIFEKRSRKKMQQEYEAIEVLIKNKISELTTKAFDAITNNNLENLKSAIFQIGDDLVDHEGNTLLDKAILADRSEIVFFLLQQAKDPRELLARFSFEKINPTTELFQYFVNLAYASAIKSDRRQAPPSEAIKHCQICSKQATKFCTGCKKVYYCSEKCQKADWKNHKQSCKC